MSEKSAANVSRETFDRLKAFEALAVKWTKKINLVSSNDSQHIWDRHIVDSLQVYQLAPTEGDWLDLGSGGGFPGLVAAILAKEAQPARRFTLVDSDQRKCTFLRTVARELELNVSVLSERINDVPPQDASVVSARALAELSTLLEFADRHMRADGIALFLKGARWREESADAKRKWQYVEEAVQSETNPDAVILKIKEPVRV
ncbi:16S rRNA (guanine(527)-N(7))-methyltransferase RsmG [Sulfitobacter sp. S190]|uniref:16S rRNA (guanine(527)-N(7))-methyltransferase RsmG n=1 Tax=Sulfitobacter sp. S190 TaxID=2867022 RepID=UPI0021A93931|nr:16S rRNA (guanine(527)-N(7))-methyltransferase RsmG [Sulfitobacter sp. S190]UWR22473.1 16S rRNA (guanine(527)-N(7))-methyltransferase RsmG [Sulfitobacter sp. S190]